MTKCTWCEEEFDETKEGSHGPYDENNDDEQCSLCCFNNQNQFEALKNLDDIYLMANQDPNSSFKSLVIVNLDWYYIAHCLKHPLHLYGKTRTKEEGY